jgi:GH43 family beta-xylosidase
MFRLRSYLGTTIASLLAAQALIGGCSGSDSASGGSAGAAAGQGGAGTVAQGGTVIAGAAGSTKAAPGGSGATSNGGMSNGGANEEAGAAGSDAQPCSTHVSYGDALDTAKHAASSDDFDGPVTWDGICTGDGASSYALLSNGMKRFTGRDQCVLALDRTCPGVGACATRVTYGSAWQRATNHTAQYDNVAGRVFWDGACANDGASSFATLSNGWAPHFDGKDACSLSFSYTQCGGLYVNPVIPTSCADPGVLRDGSQYVLSCTSGDAPNAFPLQTSTDLVHWSKVGSVFPTASKPKWAASDFWAPEIHHVGTHYVAYFTARHTDGKLSIGAATAGSATGPFVDLGQPLVHDPTMGMIDATEFAAGDGTPYLVWKEDGNASGKPTPIYGQRLTSDGTALLGTRQTLITNDLGWEGGVVEGPWVVSHAGQYYLFYSGNSYANATYAVGVARAQDPLGPYTKAGDPILKSNATWVGPGHCSVIDTPEGDTYMVYHAWPPAHDARVTLVDAVHWDDWPSVPEAPSVHSRPMP